MAKSNKNPAKKTVKKAGKATPKKSASKKAKKPLKGRKQKGEDLMCFLTTACVSYYRLPEDCYELTTLRTYRDTYLASLADGRKLIKEYYRIAPQIVESANNDPARKEVYTYIYSQVQRACREIEREKLATAKHVYLEMVRTLMKRYKTG